MIITCEECSTRFNLDESILKAGGSKVRCGLCRHVFTAFPPVPPPSIAAAEEEIEFDFSENDDPDEFKKQDVTTETQDLDFDDKELDFEETDFEIDDLDFETEEDTLDFSDPDLGVKAPEKQSADIEISFEDESETPGFEENELSFDDSDIEFDDPDLDMTSSTDPTDFNSLEFETPDPDSLGLQADDKTEDEDASEADLSFQDDPDADLVFEETGPGQDDLDLAFETEEPDDRKMTFPDLRMETDDGQNPTDEADLDLTFDEKAFEDLDAASDDGDIEGSTLPPEDFSSYDQVLDQDTEPEDTFTDLDQDPYQEQVQDPDPEDETGESEEPEPKNRLTPAEPRSLMENAGIADFDQGEPELYSGQQKKRRRNASMGAPAMLFLLLFVLVAGAYVVSMSLGYKIPYLSDVKIPFIEHYLKKEAPAKPAPKPIPNEASVNGRFISNDVAGELFVITGRIENPAEIPYSHIQVKGTLITKGKVKTKTQVAFCGNVIAEEMLKTGTIMDIDKALTIREGAHDSNVNVKPGGFVPFMLVFSDLPDNLENFTVEVVNSETAVQIK
ncbi:MAG: zinc-ribbon domain-containing protein [Proteobacteria bacterium]|nr:DUF3426 domain-containing protein [Desulfobacula sp.]MBU3950912.1 zinc-ribbon domain-containing protein [Pseudomonadota bacterium]MBU4133159.1 zinc-ribbon domain-containing protein [Pseudomonadota bacterium]